MLALSEIKEALIYGSKNNYILFPEARDKNILEAIKENDLSKRQIEKIKQIADAALNEPSPFITFKMFKAFETTGNRLIFESAYFMRRKQLFSLVLAYMIEKNQRYKEMIEEKLWEWCDIYSWELPAHFKMSAENLRNGIDEPDKTIALFAAESAFFFSEILSLIGKELDEFLVLRLKNQIFRRVIEPYKEGSYWWETAVMNWSSVCAGSVGAAAIYLMKDIDELSLIIHRVLKALDFYLKSFDKDGVTAEGLSYWSYGFSFYLFFTILLKERTCGKISLLNSDKKIKNIAKLPQILQFPSGDFVNFSDSGSEKWVGDGGVFARLEKELDIKGYNYSNSTDIFYDNTFRWASMARKLFWYCNKVENTNYILTGNFYFSESQWLVVRNNKDGIFSAFAAKGGNNGEPHNHNDLGHFILHYKDESIFIDLGSPEYVKDYFIDESRYNFLTASSFGHSVPVINRKGQKFGKEYSARVMKCEYAGSTTLFKLDLTGAYEAKELKYFEREFIWDNNLDELIIKDNFRFNTLANEIKELFITDLKPELPCKGRIKINANNSEAEMFYDDKLECIVEECNFNDHGGKKRTVYRISILGDAGNMANYIFKIKLASK